MQGQIVENTKAVMGAVPVNTTGAAVASNWISVKNAGRLQFLIQQGAWAGGTPAVTLNQATSSAGAGSKALGFSTGQVWQSTYSSDTPSQVTVSSNTFNLPNQANTLTTIDVAGQDLDLDNGFCFVQLAIASPGVNADFIAVLALLGDLAWSGKPSTQPSGLS